VSTASSQTIYTLSIMGAYGNATGQFTSNDGWSDEFAATVAADLNAIAWPAPTTCSVSKQIVEQTLFTTDLATAPVTFT
jgi:hypothetical protein